MFVLTSWWNFSTSWFFSEPSSVRAAAGFDVLDFFLSFFLIHQLNLPSVGVCWRRSNPPRWQNPKQTQHERRAQLPSSNPDQCNAAANKCRNSGSVFIPLCQQGTMWAFPLFLRWRMCRPWCVVLTDLIWVTAPDHYSCDGGCMFPVCDGTKSRDGPGPGLLSETHRFCQIRLNVAPNVIHTALK